MMPHPSAQDLDRFGGLSSLRFEPTGFFRLEKANRWWLVTPDGSAFLSFGLNHTNPEYLQKDYNIDYWRKQLGFQDPAEPAFKEGFVKKVLKDLKTFGMNTLGVHSPKDFFCELTVPYVQSLFFVAIPYWAHPPAPRFVDVFSSNFEKRCEEIARKIVLPRKDDPFLLGYIFTDCPVLTDRDAQECGQVSWGRAHANLPTWPRVLRNLGAAAPGKKAYVTLVRKRHSSIESFNQAYKTSFSSFDELVAVENWSPFVQSEGIDDSDDNHAFLMEVIERYYTTACAAIRKFDRNHLIFGDILNGQTPADDEAVSRIAAHTDLVAYQFYDGYEEQVALLDRWTELSGKPLFHADSCFSVAYEQVPAPIGAVCPDTETRARRAYDFAEKAFARPDFVGWNWCGWVDMWAAWKPDRQHSGLQDPFGNYHHPMPETLARFGSRMYDCALAASATESRES